MKYKIKVEITTLQRKTMERLHADLHLVSFFIVVCVCGYDWRWCCCEMRTGTVGSVTLSLRRLVSTLILLLVSLLLE